MQVYAVRVAVTKPMSTLKRSSIWFRFLVHTGFILVLAGSVFARASVAAPEWTNGKAVQHTLSEFKCAANWLGSDPPESKAVAVPIRMVAPALVPLVLGEVQQQQYGPMVHQLRDRLMHAPPVIL